MMKKVIPRAAEAEAVAQKMIDIMLTENPKAHYIIGKDARLATITQWLGLIGLFDKFAYKKLLTATERENTRAEEKKRKRKQKKTPTE